MLNMLSVLVQSMDMYHRALETINETINKEGYYQMPQMEAVKPTVLPFLIIRAGYKPVIPEI